MSELDYIRDSLNDLKDALNSRCNEIKSDIDQIERKLDRYLEETVTQRSEINHLKDKTSEHDRILTSGNGQKPMTVQLGELGTEVVELKADIEECKKKSGVPGDPSAIKKEKLKNLGKVGTILVLILSAALQWIGIKI